MTDRVAALVRDIEAIPDVYARLAEGKGFASAFRAVLEGPQGMPSQVVLTGLGSSRFAALQVEARLRAAGVDTVVEPASHDAPVAPAAGRLGVVVSSSGVTPEVVAAARRHHVAGTVLAITRDPGSPVAAAADATAKLDVAAEESGIATTSYAATLAALVHLAAALGAAGGSASAAQELRAGAHAARAVLAARDTWLPDALAAVRSVEAISVLAPWSERGHAEQVALLFREGPRRSADVFETAEWLHVGIYTALPGTLALLLVGSPADAEVARTIAARSGRVIVVGDPAAGIQPQVAGPLIPSPAGIARFVGPALLAAELWRLHAGG